MVSYVSRSLIQEFLYGIQFAVISLPRKSSVPYFTFLYLRLNIMCTELSQWRVAPRQEILDSTRNVHCLPARVSELPLLADP